MTAFHPLRTYIAAFMIAGTVMGADIGALTASGGGVALAMARGTSASTGQR